MATSVDVLCSGFPDEFAEYISYARSLRFDEQPDYNHLRKLFRTLFIRLKLNYDYQFDWSIRDDKTADLQS